MALGRGQTTEVGAYANQRLNLAKLGRPMEEMPWFPTGPGKTGRPGLSGGPAKRSHGGIVNPSCNRKGKCGNPAPTAGARGFYPNRGEPGLRRAPDTHPTRSGVRVSQGLAGVRKAARNNKEMKFTALLHHLTVDLLRESFYSLKRKAAPGVDGSHGRSMKSELKID